MLIKRKGNKKVKVKWRDRKRVKGGGVCVGNRCDETWSTKHNTNQPTHTFWQPSAHRHVLPLPLLPDPITFKIPS